MVGRGKFELGLRLEGEGKREAGLEVFMDVLGEKPGDVEAKKKFE
jgi:hypothetical protein